VPLVNVDLQALLELQVKEVSQEKEAEMVPLAYKVNVGQLDHLVLLDNLAHLDRVDH